MSNSLVSFHRARGYAHKVEKLFFDHRLGQVVRAEHVERFPPDTTAAFIWLKNRKPAEWRDYREDSPVDPEQTAQHIRTMVGALLAIAPAPAALAAEPAKPA